MTTQRGDGCFGSSINILGHPGSVSDLIANYLAVALQELSPYFSSASPSHSGFPTLALPTFLALSSPKRPGSGLTFSERLHRW